MVTRLRMLLLLYRHACAPSRPPRHKRRTTPRPAWDARRALRPRDDDRLDPRFATS